MNKGPKQGESKAQVRKGKSAGQTGQETIPSDRAKSGRDKSSGKSSDQMSRGKSSGKSRGESSRDAGSSRRGDKSKRGGGGSSDQRE